MSAGAVSGERRTSIESGGETRIPTHFPDALRVGVLAGLEDEELRLEAHFLGCEFCREQEVTLAEYADTPEGRCAPQVPVSCFEARNFLFRYFDQGRGLSADAVAHLNACECCHDHFLAPAQVVRGLEVDADSVSAID